MYLASQPTREIRIFVIDGTVRADTLISGHRAYLKKIFVSTGKLDIFHVNYIELFGSDVVTGQKRYEKVVP
jgi:hypothetical protein